MPDTIQVIFHFIHLLPSPKLYHKAEEGTIAKKEGGSRLNKPCIVQVGTCTPIDPIQIPEVVGVLFAQTLLPDLQRAYADPFIQADYQKWKAKRLAENVQNEKR